MKGANPEVVSSAVINFNLASMANVTMTNILFENNVFLGTKAVVSQKLVNYFILKNSNFSGESLLQNTNYIDIQQAINVQIQDNSFSDCSYVNSGDSGVYLLYIEKVYSANPGINSFIQNIDFTGIKTNAISFGGFEEVDPLSPGTGNFVV